MFRQRAFCASVVALLFPALLVTIQAASWRQVAGTPRADQSVPAPDHWVAFDAIVRTIGPRGVTVGKFYRGSDGSTRNDSGPEDNPSRIVSISNVSLITHYEGIDGTWKSYPMKLPAGDYRPGLRSLTRTHGLEASTLKILGFTVYRLESTGGVVRYQAPDLNFFALVTEFQDTRQECSDVVIRDQPAAVFMPPPGVVVEPQSQYRGIVSDR
jgi:hypothetical protein